MKIKSKLDHFMSDRRCTLLGVGPMSVNCVDATIELANTYDALIMLIASRRQVEMASLNGGYVNNWSTEDYAQYINDHDKKRNILLARDHGGPWQNEIEKSEKYNLRRAMKSAKKSYQVDIESGFEIIHIDPSIDIHSDPSVDEIIERVFELYEFCWKIARENQKDILFEIGTEEQTGGIHCHEELEYLLSKIETFCKSNKLPLPTFVVVQTGTRVMETRNIGSFEGSLKNKDGSLAESQLLRMIEMCNKFGIFIKEHNADYLSDKALSQHPLLGIHAANIAPEFGVAETCGIIEIMDKKNLTAERDAFLELAYNSRRWEKWMMPGTMATDRDRSIIAGHYVFSDPRFQEIKNSLQAQIKSIDIDEHLTKIVRKSILRYLKHFNLLN
jgi:hypothetical protein